MANICHLHRMRGEESPGGASGRHGAVDSEIEHCPPDLGYFPRVGYFVYLHVLSDHMDVVFIYLAIKWEKREKSCCCALVSLSALLSF